MNEYQVTTICECGKPVSTEIISKARDFTIDDVVTTYCEDCKEPETLREMTEGEKELARGLDEAFADEAEPETAGGKISMEDAKRIMEINKSIGYFIEGNYLKQVVDTNNIRIVEEIDTPPQTTSWTTEIRKIYDKNTIGAVDTEFLIAFIKEVEASAYKQGYDEARKRSQLSD